MRSMCTMWLQMTPMHTCQYLTIAPGAVKPAACQEDQQQPVLLAKLVCTEKYNMGMHWRSPALHYSSLDCLALVCCQTCPQYSEAAVVCYAVTASTKCGCALHSNQLGVILVIIFVLYNRWTLRFCCCCNVTIDQSRLKDFDGQMCLGQDKM